MSRVRRTTLTPMASQSSLAFTHCASRMKSIIDGASTPVRVMSTSSMIVTSMSDRPRASSSVRVPVRLTARSWPVLAK